MTLTISISAEAEAKLMKKAKLAGVDAATYAAQLIELLVEPPPSLKEISGPIAEEFARSGMTEDELSEFLEAEKHAMRAERREEARRMTGDLRVVFDCNVFLQAMSDTGAPSGQCVKLAFEGKAELFISRFVINELRRVTTRPKVVAKLRLSSDRIDQFLTAIERVATLIVNVPEFFSYRRDPTDAHYINLALAANAKLIVSRDRDLLDLMDRTKPEAADFNNRFPQLQILDPVEFLREVSAT